MSGLRPIVEMMTFNFSMLALDQIVNSAAKMLYMSGGQFNIPVVVRGPGGAGHQLGAQHSQSLESWFCHVPGLKVVAPATPADAKGLLKTSIRDNNPVVFIESEVLYGTRGEVPEGEHLIPLGVADIKRPGRDVTIVAHSKMVLVALDAAADLASEGIEAEVVDPRTLRPLDTEAIVNSVKKTNRVVIVEEGWEYCGVGAQFVDVIQRAAFDYLDAPILRVTGAGRSHALREEPGTPGAARQAEGEGRGLPRAVPARRQETGVRSQHRLNLMWDAWRISFRLAIALIHSSSSLI